MHIQLAVGFFVAFSMNFPLIKNGKKTHDRILLALRLEIVEKASNCFFWAHEK